MLSTKKRKKGQYIPKPEPAALAANQIQNNLQSAGAYL